MADNDIAKEAWLAEPFTQRVLEQLKRAEHDRLQDLLSACRKSQDPGVLKAFFRHENATFTKELFAKGVYRDG